MSRSRESRQCAEYRADAPWCRAGFVQKPICSGYAGCPHCGAATEASTPNCQREDLPDFWINEDGSGRFKQEGIAP